GAGAVVERGAETHLPGALGLDADGSVPLGHLPEVVRGRASRAERVTQLLLAAGGRALATAGFDAAAAAETRAGIVVGTAFGCFLTNAAYQRRVAAGGQAAASRPAPRRATASRPPSPRPAPTPASLPRTSRWSCPRRRLRWRRSRPGRSPPRSASAGRGC